MRFEISKTMAFYFLVLNKLPRRPFWLSSTLKIEPLPLRDRERVAKEPTVFGGLFRDRAQIRFAAMMFEIANNIDRYDDLRSDGSDHAYSAYRAELASFPQMLETSLAYPSSC
jgi:hypothetical protein